MDMEIFVHVDDSGISVGNGGFKMLVNFAEATSRMGHDVFMFSQSDTIRWSDLDWIAREPEKSLSFKLARFNNISQNSIVVSIWLNSLLNEDDRLIGNLNVDNIRYWNHDEIYRTEHRDTRLFILDNFDKIAIANRALIDLNTHLGFDRDQIICLDNWLRRDVFYPDSYNRIKESVGYLPDGARPERSMKSRVLHPIASSWPWLPNRLTKPYGGDFIQYDIYNILERDFPDREIILCNEYYTIDVARRMRQSDIFFFFPRFRNERDQQPVYESELNQICEYPLGEGFGLPLFEAMSCGCACVARRHEAIKFLEGIVPLVDSLEEGLKVINGLEDRKKNKIRKSSFQIIEERCRLNNEKRENIAELLL